MPTMMTAVRTANRLIQRHYEAQAPAIQADMQFDGGEWSGPAWSAEMAQTEDRLVDLVAERFGVSSEDLFNCLLGYWNTEPHIYQ